MANKKISQLSPSSTNLADDDFLEVEKNGDVTSKKFTGAQIRALEKSERQTTDNAIIGAVGLDTDGSFVPFSGTNYIDGAVDIADALELLDEAIDSEIAPTLTFANVGIGQGNVYKEEIGGEVRLKTIKAGNNVSVSDDVSEITIGSDELGNILDSQGQIIVFGATEPEALNPNNDGSDYLLHEKNGNVNWKDVSDSVAIGINNGDEKTDLADDYLFGITKTSAGLDKVSWESIKNELLNDGGFSKVVYSQLSTITSNNSTKTYLIATSAGVEIPTEYLTVGRVIRVTIRGEVVCTSAEGSEVTVYFYPVLGSESGIAEGKFNVGNLGIYQSTVELTFDLTIRTTGSSGIAFLEGQISHGITDTSSSIQRISSKTTFNVNTTVDNTLAIGHGWDTDAATKSLYIYTGTIELL